MVVLHAFLALLSGFATMAILIAVITILLRRLTPDWVDTAKSRNPGYVFVNIGYSFAAAAAGGYVTAWIAQQNPLIHALALAIAVLLLSALSALQQRGQHPVWYLLALVAITPVGVLAGGLIRLRVLGIL
jgi:quinol-cytochrome oxidoreductase complex cytochrome b subunit